MRNWAENQVKLVLIRHGATASNKEHRYLGKSDETLCKEGISSLIKAKYAGIYPEVDYLFSSPMKRCLQTARILYSSKEPVIIPEWEEMDFGAFEGKNYTELQGDIRYQAWIDSNGTLPFPEGESREDFIARCERGFHRMLKYLSDLPCNEHRFNITAGMIVHGGTIMSLLSRYRGGEYFDYQVSNGSGYFCTLKGNINNSEITDIEKIKGV